MFEWLEENLISLMFDKIFENKYEHWNPNTFENTCPKELLSKIVRHFYSIQKLLNIEKKDNNLMYKTAIFSMRD